MAIQINYDAAIQILAAATISDKGTHLPIHGEAFKVIDNTVTQLMNENAKLKAKKDEDN